MNDPIKIIWKFKNDNRRTQYHQYIFIGTVPKNITKILDKIADVNFYDSLILLTKQEYDALEKMYGEKWYYKFFNTYHVNSAIVSIKESSTQKKELTDKYSKTWFETHIESHQLIEKKLIYSYASLIKDERARKNIKKGRTVATLDDDIDIDYTTSKKMDVKKLFDQKNKTTTIQEGGDDEDDYESGNFEETYDDDEIIDDKEEDEDNDEENNDMEDGDEKEEDEFNAGLENETVLEEEEMDIDEIEEMYRHNDVDPDKEVMKTSDLIKQALDDERLFEKKISQMIEFDKTKDTNIYDENIKNVFKKIYVTSQYIFKDDTVKTMRDKICCGIKNNSKFGKNAYLIPSRQYLWSEYYFENNVEKIMIGQKWMKKNELLSIDVEPNNNLRYYEELIGQLKTLKDNIRRYGNKIRREDDDTNILYDYENYIMNNEIYMIDIYNELGKNYNPDPEIIKNLADVFIRIYFPKIKQDELKYVLEYLNGNDQKSEYNKIMTVFETINNDLIMENEIMNVVEDVKLNEKYEYIFKENYITQSVIHVNLRQTTKTKIDLYRIYNEFEVSDKYPFIQFQIPDGTIIYKFSESEIDKYLQKKDNSEVLSKWFENAPYGISFKVKIQDKSGEKFMAMTLNENGRIEYKTQWKEEDMATINDIKLTYNYVKDLILKLNREPNKVNFELPYDSEFKYAFINTIQKFELPEKYNINHNDLSEFSRFFYPYIALVIEPRKRQAKIQKDNDKSKFGTYLRYKRVSKYENQARLEQRIMYFMRNYEFTDVALANEISKQFNITDERSLEEIEKVKAKYPNLKKSRKVLKKLENIPKYKPPGIGIDIQGKQRDKYKIRISGARDKDQLDRMIMFMNILIHLYIETYLYKKKERQILKEKLKKLNKIAKRRSKVDDIVNYEKDQKSVKQMAQVDKQRIGFKPDKGQNQWTRSCQNSGDDKKRRPQQYNTSKLSEMIKAGYQLNKKTGMYEKVVQLKKGSKKTDIVLKTIRLPEVDAEGNNTGNEIHYGCDPDENGEHMYVGFLTRSMNPFGHCMPCCFKKDPMISKNKEKRKFFQECLGNAQEGTEQKDPQKVMGDRLYILQDTNKIQEGRFGFLPKYLDFYFNFMLNKEKKIKHHYLVKTNTGYFFKYGSKQDEMQFMNAFSSCVDLSIEQIRSKIINALEKDKNDQIFTSLNNGDIKTQYDTRENYINFIKNNAYLDYEMTNDILSVPDVIINGGINFVIFQKKTIIIKKTLEKEKIREDFVLNCQNVEDSNNLINPEKNTIFLIKENKNFYPISLVKKDDETTKSMEIIKMFKYENKKDNIVSHIKEFFDKNCKGSFMDSVAYKESPLTAKDLVVILDGLKNKDYQPKYQIIDVRNKCKYIITQNNLIIPCRSSGSLYNLQIVKSAERYISEFKDVFNKLHDLYKMTDKAIPVKPFGIYYDEKNGENLRVTGITTKTRDVIPVKPEIVKIQDLEKMSLIYENKPLTDKIDSDLLKGRSSGKVDNRILSVNLDKYETESYELFRLEFSEYVNRPENIQLKTKIENIMNDHKTQRKDKIDKLRLIVYRLIDKELYDKYKKYVLSGSQEEFEDTNLDVDDNATSEDENSENIQTGGKYDKLLHISNKIPDLLNYDIKNDRSTCATNKEKDTCNTNPHCHWTHSGCYMSLTRELIIKFVNKLCEDLASNDLKAFEVMKIGNYFVSDIVDYNKFTERKDQKILRSTSNNVKKALNELFGKDNTPKIGKRRTGKNLEINYQQLNIDNPLVDMKEFYIQNIIEGNLTVFRAYVNGYYWVQNKFNDNDSKNLGYYSPLQTDLANYFRSLVIEWLQHTKNKETIKNELFKYMQIKKSSKSPLEEFIIKIAQDIPTLTNCIVELYVLSKINLIPIVVYDDDNNIKYVFDEGIKYNVSEQPNKTNINSYKSDKNIINLKFSFITNQSIPDDIDVIYYK